MSSFSTLDVSSAQWLSVTKVTPPFCFPSRRVKRSFRLGEIEHLPVGELLSELGRGAREVSFPRVVNHGHRDGVVNCVISNCVINLSPDKPQVYREMNRVLVPGGRVSISDVLRMSDIPTELKTAQSYSC
ncbi:unnamed protein product [Durusdinium trenchii]|uniref:Methyltransferase domain-containing protein n=1 Tax=Durusdinium trenchii TaxID=1381693 RepID=A0ABP0PKF4_9DINO